MTCAKCGKPIEKDQKLRYDDSATEHVECPPNAQLNLTGDDDALLVDTPPEQYPD